MFELPNDCLKIIDNNIVETEEINIEDDNIIQRLKDYIDFMIQHNKSSLAISHSYLQDSIETIREGRHLRNKLREYKKLRDWDYLKRNEEFDKEKQV